MQRNRIVIDCDPGIDDTFALILCIKKLDVAGIVAVGGNTGLPVHFEKRKICDRTYGKNGYSGLRRL
ncbi:MAG: nucleoside hydrolase [Pilosibacter sp.]